MPTFDNYLDFEKGKKPFFDELYKDMGCEIVDRNDCKEYDLKLKLNGVIFTVEEKARMKTWDDILVEIVQDTETEHPGWIYYTEADFLIYGMFGDPTKVYRLKLELFKKWFGLCEGHFKTVESSEGWGNTINKKVPIDEIPPEIIRRLV